MVVAFSLSAIIALGLAVIGRAWVQLYRLCHD